MLVSGRDAGFMTIETHRYVVEQGCSFTGQRLNYILPGKPFYVYITNLTIRVVNLLKSLIVSSVSNALSCIVQAFDDEPCTMESEDQASKQCSLNNLVYSVHYEPSECHDKLVDRQNVVIESDRNIR